MHINIKTCTRGGTLSVTVNIIENGIDPSDSNLGRDCIFLRANALRKDMNPSACPTPNNA